MPKRRTIQVSEEERAALETMRRRDPKPYLRERASAILKIADGLSAHWVACHGLLRKRNPDRVYEWLNRYEAHGIEGLHIKPGRGRKPAFSPTYESEAEAETALLHVVRRSPSHFGYRRSRWTLRMLGACCDWLRLKSLGGLSRLLKRLGIHFKRARDYVYSPDVNYDAKVADIERAQLRAYYAPERYTLLYLDQFSFFRQPSLASAYAKRGHHQPLAHRSYRTNTKGRLVATLDAISGQVLYRQRSRITVPTVRGFWYDICAAYPKAETIYVVLDNWPVHFHPDALVALQPQQFPWPIKVPHNWPSQPSPRSKEDNLPIQLLPLPTYASWLNPIEKLWRWLSQDVLHLHRLADDWSALKQAVTDFLDQFQNGSDELLHYVGLLPY